VNEVPGIMAQVQSGPIAFSNFNRFFLFGLSERGFLGERGLRLPNFQPSHASLFAKRRPKKNRPTAAGMTSANSDSLTIRNIMSLECHLGFSWLKDQSRSKDISRARLNTGYSNSYFSQEA
jgi:hypothetical protein